MIISLFNVLGMPVPSVVVDGLTDSKLVVNPPHFKIISGVSRVNSFGQNL